MELTMETSRMSRASKSPRARPGTYHHGNLRQALVDAALELIADKGARAFTLREAARRAGVSHTAPYRHFADREALLAAVAEEGFRELGARMRAAGAAVADPAAGFAAEGLAYVRFAVEKPSHFRVMFGGFIADPHGYPALARAGAEAYRQLVDGVRAGQDAGLIRAGDPEELALLPWSVVHGLAALLIDRQLPADPDQVDALAARVIAAMGAGLSVR
jgi:AcrR family transcriptional regulator